MPWHNSLLPESTSHRGINLVKVANDRCQGSCTCWSYLNICFEESLWVGLRPCLQKAGLNKILWLLRSAGYSPSWFGRRSWGNTGVWLARREETQEVFFIALFFIHRSVSLIERIRTVNEPKRIQEGATLESRQARVQTKNCTHLIWKVSQVSTGESGFCRQFSDFLLATPPLLPPSHLQAVTHP